MRYGTKELRDSYVGPLVEEEVTAVLLIATGTELARKIQRTQNDNEVQAHHYTYALLCRGHSLRAQFRRHDYSQNAASIDSYHRG